MFVGISAQIMNWTFSSYSSNLSGVNSDSLNLIKSILGYISVVGWIVFFVGLGIRQLDNKRDLRKGKNNKKD